MVSCSAAPRQLRQPSSDRSRHHAYFHGSGKGPHLGIGGRTVTTEGVVTAVAPDGFYLQDPVGDGDDATSDAVWVAPRTPPTVAQGDHLRVRGTVGEFVPGGESTANLTTTEITEPLAIEVRSRGARVPNPIVLGRGGRRPPSELVIDPNGLPINLRNQREAPGNRFNPDTDGIDFYESLEGMLVTIRIPWRCRQPKRSAARAAERLGWRHRHGIQDRNQHPFQRLVEIDTVGVGIESVARCLPLVPEVDRGSGFGSMTSSLGGRRPPRPRTIGLGTRAPRERTSIASGSVISVVVRLAVDSPPGNELTDGPSHSQVVALGNRRRGPRSHPNGVRRGIIAVTHGVLEVETVGRNRRDDSFGRYCPAHQSRDVALSLNHGNRRDVGSGLGRVGATDEEQQNKTPPKRLPFLDSRFHLSCHPLDDQPQRHLLIPRQVWSPIGADWRSRRPQHRAPASERTHERGGFRSGQSKGRLERTPPNPSNRVRAMSR